jgi:hypothetical protein
LNKTFGDDEIADSYYQQGRFTMSRQEWWGRYEEFYRNNPPTSGWTDAQRRQYIDSLFAHAPTHYVCGVWPKLTFLK